MFLMSMLCFFCYVLWRKKIEDKNKVVKFSANLPPGNSAVGLCGLPPWSLAVGTSAAVNGLTAVRHTYRRNLRR